MAKRKDAPSSVLTRSGRGTSAGIKASTDHLNTRKYPRFEKQIGPNPSTVKKKAEKTEKQMGSTLSTVKKKPDKSEKQMESTPLRRSERGKNPVDVPALKVKSTKKSADISVASAEDVDKEKEDGSRDSKKRKRYNAVEFRARYKPQRVRVETEVLTHTESPSSSGDQFWSAAVGNGTSVANETADGNADDLYQHLKPTMFELCNILKFSEGAKIIVERFLKFVIGNFNVSKEHTNVLEALMISVCWICSSLSKHTIDRKESFTLATVHLNFSCNEEEADQVYEKLKKPKEMFLESPMNLKVLNAYKDLASGPEEPIKLPAVPPNPQEQEQENHGASNEKAFQGSGQILEEDIARKERNEIEKFDREWNEKKMAIINEFELEKTLIRYLYSSNSSVRSEKLNLVEKELADELNKHEKLRQVVVNNEISLNGAAHETQIVDLVEREKEDQEILEVSPALLGNQIEAEIHDKPVDDMCPMVVPNGVVNLSDSSNDMVSISHTSEKHMANAMVLSEPIGEASEKQDADTVNDVAEANATTLSEPIGEAPEKQDADTVNDVAEANVTALSEPIGEAPANLDADMGNGVAGADATVLSEPVGDSPAIEIIASEQQDGDENVVSGDDAMVLSEPIGESRAKQDADMGNDVAGAYATVVTQPIRDIPAIEEIASEQQDEVVSGDDAMVSSETIGDISAKQHAVVENDLAEAEAMVLSEPIGDIPAIEEIASEQEDEVENVVLGDDAVVSSERSGDISANMENDVAEANATVPSKTIGDIPGIEESAPEQDGEVENVASSEPIGDIPVIEESASEQHNEVENVVSGDDSVVSSEPIGDIPAKQHTDMEIDVAGQDASLELEVPEVDFNKENGKGEGTSSPDGSHAVEARSETGQNDLMPHVDLVEMEIPAINNLGPHADSADGSHAVEDPSGTGSIDVVLHAEPPVVGIPVGQSMTSNVDSMVKSSPVLDPNATGPNDIASHVNTGEMEILADNDSAPHVGSSADGSNTVDDGNETAPTDMAPRVDNLRDLVRADATVINKPIREISAKMDADMENDKAGKADSVEMEVLEVDTNKENPKECVVEGCNETGHDDLASHVDSAEMEMLAVNDISQNVESADGSGAAEDTVRTSHDDVALDAESADMGTPTSSEMPNGTDMERNLESTDGLHAVEDPVGTSPDGVAPHVESIEMGISADKGMPTGNCMEPDLEPVDGSHAVGDPNASGPIDVAPHIESAELEIPAVECNKENADDGTVRTGTSQGVEDHNLTSGSSSSSSSSSSTDVPHAVSDRSVPPTHNIQSECLQAQQSPDSGIQDQEVQAKSTLMVQIEDENIQPVYLGQVDQIMLDNSSSGRRNELVVVAERSIPDPVITEDQSAIVPMSEVLAQTPSQSMVAAETLIINPVMTENQTTILQMSEVLSTLEPIVAVGTPTATHPQIQNAAPLEPDCVAPHEESAELRISAVEYNKENADDGTMSAGTSHGVENLKDSSDSSSRLSLSSAGVAHVVSEDSVPVIRDIQNGSLQVQLLCDNGIQDQEVQAESTPMVEIEDNSLQFVDMGQGDPIIPDDSSPNSHNEPFVAAETHVTDPMVTEDQLATLPASEVLAQATSEPIVASETPITEAIVAVEAPITDPIVATETPMTDPMVTEDQSATLPASEVLAQTTSEPIIAAETPVTEPIIAAQTPITTEPIVATETPMTDPVVTEDQSATLPASEVLAQTTSEPIVASETPITEPIVAVEAPITEPTIVATETPMIDPMVTEDQSATLPASEVLAQTTSEPIIAAETPVTEPIIAAQTPITTEPIVATETPMTDPVVTEDQSATLPASEVLAQTTSEPIVASETPITEPIVAVEAPITEPIVAAVTPITEPVVAAESSITAHIRIQNASQLERIYQLGSRVIPGDPLHLELQRLHSGKENMVKMHQENMQKISVDCEKEIAEVIAQIKLKYGNKRQEAEIAYNSQYQEAESNMHKVAWNIVLAAAFRSKCKDLTPDHAGLQQASQAGLMQQLQRLPGPSSVRRSPTPPPQISAAPRPPPQISAASAAAPPISAAPLLPPLPATSMPPPQPPPLPATSMPPPQPPPLPATSMPPPQPPQLSVTSMPPLLPQRTQPPLQIVDNASALFSTPLTRRSHTTNLRPTTTTPIRPQPTANPIPSIPSTTTTSIAAPIVTPITTSTTSSPIRLPHGSNHLSPSITQTRPPIRLHPLDMSAANLRINTETLGQSPHSRPLGNGVSRGVAPHMRPMVNREVRAPGPHLRPVARSDVRSPAPHMRSFASTGVRFAAPHMRPIRPTSEPSTLQPQLPGQHVTSDIPSTSTSQPPVSVSPVRPLAPLRPKPFPVSPPAAARSASPQPPPPPPPSSHTSHHHPQRNLNDNVNVLMDNVARRINIMSTPNIPAGGNAAQTSSATEVVYLSDDE